MKYVQWKGGDFDEAAADRLRAAGYPALLSAVLAARGVSWFWSGSGPSPTPHC